MSPQKLTTTSPPNAPPPAPPVNMTKFIIFYEFYSRKAF